MKFLIDNQLPSVLARHLKQQGHEAFHVFDFGLAQASDTDIWRRCRDERYVLVSKDEDFLNLSLRDAEGPQVIWVRLTNCRNSALIAAFDQAIPKLIQALENGQRIVELR
ncbi:MAG: hypothetical protein GC164_11215 [Phycisphaera sp.]|nr:hypothetical protein [Phycisphaera sp.]